MSDESLYRELQEKEREEDERYRQNQAPKELNKVSQNPWISHARDEAFSEGLQTRVRPPGKARVKAYRLVEGHRPVDRTSDCPPTA